MDVNRILLDILIVLVAAKAAAELADRIRLPAVVGEIVAGIIVGPSVLGWVHSSEALQTLAQLGVILLLLEVGLEMDLAELGSVGRAAILVALTGVAIPMVTGVGAGIALGMSGKEALFVGAALTATSVGITARVFGDLRALASVEARTVLGAAVADDVLGLVILTVVTRIVTEGSVSILGVAWVVIVAIGFVVLATLIGVRVVPQMFAMVRRYSRSPGTLVVIALAFTLAVSELAHAAQLAPIVGAFVAGIALARSSAAGRVRSELAPIAHLLVPVFFLQIGIDADVTQFARPAVFGTAAVLLVIAVLGKLASVVGLIGSPGDRLLVGIGMIPRGEVGLIFATIGLNQHVFGQNVYAALLLVVLLTTVATPPALRWRLLALRAKRAGATGATSTAGAALVRVGRTGLVELHAEPVPRDALVVALRAALLCSEHTASPALSDWLDNFPAGTRKWDDASRAEFFKLLRDGRPRSWRLLIGTGILQRSLPELDDALARQRADAFELDPLSSLHFPRLVAVHELSVDGPVAWRSVLLAALVLDACGDPSPDSVSVGRQTVQRLGLGNAVEQRVVGLVSDAELLSAAARRWDALTEETVQQIAVHLETEEQARALHLLSRAAPDPASAEDLARLGTLYELISDALAHPEVVGPEASNEIERRRASARSIVMRETVRARITSAPRAFVLSQSPEDLARQASLCEPPPVGDEMKAAVKATADGIQIEIVARDRVGLLAHTTAVFVDFHCTITEASVATWGDGVALATYRAHAHRIPDERVLERELAAAVLLPLTSAPAPHLTLQFDDTGSPWHTRCIATGPDQPGSLHALTVAFATARASVHAAHVTTDGADATDHFDLTDHRGAKLDDRTKQRIVEAVANGTALPKRRFRFSRAARTG